MVPVQGERIKVQRVGMGPLEAGMAQVRQPAASR